MIGTRYATAICCDDPVAHGRLRAWLDRMPGVELVDIITETAPEALLDRGSEVEVTALLRKTAICLRVYRSRLFVIAGYAGCAGVPQEPELHREQVAHAVERVAAWRWPVRVIGIRIDHSGEIEVVSEWNGVEQVPTPGEGTLR